ncbi:MAG: selenide, water dikinase SelD [Deltaproteobacteria bacterium GWC2_42_11]|nr:MAG: selenide, water dikinase SelD [Deltaproteobacteria bacterium GWC2_42_11]
MTAKSLMQVLHHLPDVKDENLIAGIDTASDAGVYKISEDTAVVNTVDFFPPIVDDPYLFGQIAAANALSDVYAMGGMPKLAMNIVCFPPDLDLSILEEIIKGSLDKLKEAGVILIGGHSIEDKEVKYGLSVTGFVHPDKVVKNSGAKSGDVLVLTKPIGVGIITSALKNRNISESDADESIISMKTLNNISSKIMVETGVNACTDITGFGLIGHAVEMADASDVSIVLKSKSIPVFNAAMKLAKKRSNLPKSVADGKGYFKERVLMDKKIKNELVNILYNPETSGGLLISVPKGKKGELMDKLKARGSSAYEVGEVVKRNNEWVICVR